MSLKDHKTIKRIRKVSTYITRRILNQVQFQPQRCEFFSLSVKKKHGARSPSTTVDARGHRSLRCGASLVARSFCLWIGRLPRSRMMMSRRGSSKNWGNVNKSRKAIPRDQLSSFKNIPGAINSRISVASINIARPRVRRNTTGESCRISDVFTASWAHVLRVLSKSRSKEAWKELRDATKSSRMISPLQQYRHYHYCNGYYHSCYQ